jgi:hypothetical protein
VGARAAYAARRALDNKEEGARADLEVCGPTILVRIGAVPEVDLSDDAAGARGQIITANLELCEGTPVIAIAASVHALATLRDRHRRRQVEVAVAAVPILRCGARAAIRRPCEAPVARVAVVARKLIRAARRRPLVPLPVQGFWSGAVSGRAVLVRTLDVAPKRARSRSRARVHRVSTREVVRQDHVLRKLLRDRASEEEDKAEEARHWRQLMKKNV